MVFSKCLFGVRPCHPRTDEALWSVRDLAWADVHGRGRLGSGGLRRGHRDRDSAWALRRHWEPRVIERYRWPQRAEGTTALLAAGHPSLVVTVFLLMVLRDSVSSADVENGGQWSPARLLRHKHPEVHGDCSCLSLKYVAKHARGLSQELVPCVALQLSFHVAHQGHASPPVHSWNAFL